MNQHIMDKIYAYLDGELDANESRSFVKHLEGCVACRTRFDQIQALLQDAKELRHFPVASFFAARVIARAKTHKSESILGILDFIPRFVINGTFVFALLSILFLYFSNQGNSTLYRESSAVNVESILLNEAPSNGRLVTDEQTLQFALSSTSTLGTGANQ